MFGFFQPPDPKNHIDPSTLPTVSRHPLRSKWRSTEAWPRSSKTARSRCLSFFMQIDSAGVLGSGDGRWDGRFPRFQAGCKVRLHHFSGFFFERQNSNYLWVQLYKFIHIYMFTVYENIYIYICTFVYTVQQMIRWKLGCVVSFYKAPASYFTLRITANGAHLLWFLFIILLQKVQVEGIFSVTIWMLKIRFQERYPGPYRFQGDTM